MDYTISADRMARIAAVVRRLYSQDRMDGDTMRDAAMMLAVILGDVDYDWSTLHATYDARLRKEQ